MKLKAIQLILFLLCLLTLSGFSTNAHTSDICDSTSGAYDESSDVNNEGLINVIVDVGKSSMTLVTLATSILLPALTILIVKVEIPVAGKCLIPAITFIYIFILRLLLKSSSPDFWVTAISVCFLEIVLLYIIYLKKRLSLLRSSTDEDISTVSNIEKRVCSYIRKHIKKCHPAIESIQLYSSTKENHNEYTTFKVDYIFGSAKEGVEINALLSMMLSINSDDFVQFSAILEQYNKFVNGTANWEEQEALKALLENTITQKIEVLKDSLQKIPSSDKVSINDCCLARLLLAYLSMFPGLENSSSFIGLKENSLGLEPEIERALFTLKRTGILGAILLKNLPYIFCYKRDGDKKGRFYCTLYYESNQKGYIVLISLRNKDNSIRIDSSVEKALQSMQQYFERVFCCNNKNELEV
nr:hypothetical protein [uncultured Oscillibacter sp.]